MAHELDGRRVAILVTDGFEQVELTEPKRAPERAGATVHVAWPKDHEVTGWKLTDRDDRFKVDLPLEKASPDDYDGPSCRAGGSTRTTPRPSTPSWSRSSPRTATRGDGGAAPERGRRRCAGRMDRAVRLPPPAPPWSHRRGGIRPSAGGAGDARHRLPLVQDHDLDAAVLLPPGGRVVGRDRAGLAVAA
ncbi:MAG TPA: DJ-1/PfpI family protein, partial [Geminicoccaceae bacterium]|nr:DJ-1/PfpI family protein [Geminicoccaceae bacterium]